MKLTINYGKEVVVLPLHPLLERARKATKNDTYLLLVLASDPLLREDYPAHADRAAAAAGVTRAELDHALAFWQGAGLIDADMPEETEEAVPPAPVPTPDKQKLERESSIPHYTTEQLTELLEARADAKYLIDAAQQTFGKIFTTPEINIVLGMRDYLALENEYILILLAWCAGKEKKTLRYAEKMALSLWDEDIRDADALNRYLRRRDENEALIAKFRRIFGADSRSLSTKEKTAFLRWIEEYGFGTDMVTLAYEVTVDAISKPSVAYTDSVLRRWHEEGIDSPEKASADIAARTNEKKEQAGSSSFDTNDFFEDALRRSYGDA